MNILYIKNRTLNFLILCIGIQSFLLANDLSNPIKTLKLNYGEKAYSVILQNDSLLIPEPLFFNARNLIISKIRLHKSFKTHLKKGNILPIISNRYIIFKYTKEGEKKIDTIFVNLDPLGKKLFTKNQNKKCKTGYLSFDSLRVINNQWGKYKIKKGTFSQCIFIKDTLDSKIFGWNWNMPQKAYGVISYPEIHYHVGGTNISSIQYLKADFKANIFSLRGRYNLAYDLWIHTLDRNGKKKIHTEIMVWETSKGSKPNGKYKKDIVTKNGTYKLYVGEVNNKRIKNRWNYIALVNKNKRQRGRTDLDQILEILVHEKLLDSNLKLASVEFGTEIVNSEGYVIFENYTLSLINKRM